MNRVFHGGIGVDTMASLKDIIKEEYSTIADGIAWVAIYKEGRSWKSDYFYEESGSYDEGLVFSADDMEELRRISRVDNKAICINGYYMGFGEDFTLKEMEDKILWMYTERLNQLKGDFLGGLTEE